MIVLILGNGFDLNLGLKTRYRDFIESDEWKEMFHKQCDINGPHSLLWYIKSQSEDSLWSGIEESLYEYASTKPLNTSEFEVDLDMIDYDAINMAMGRYNRNHVYRCTHPLDENKYIAARLLNSFHQFFTNNSKELFTFNFSPLRLLIEEADAHGVPFEEYVHGESEKDETILGIDVDDLDEINPQYSFLIKSNHPRFKPTNLLYALEEAEEVVVFGHSFGRMDKQYFIDWLKMLSSGSYGKRQITIITYNDRSRLNVLDNIRRMGISVTKLRSFNSFDVICTDKIQDNESDDCKLFDALLERLRKENISDILNS